jgi:tRNA threonylcarbamoyladenosine biosynthesis protein TsaB
MGGARFVKILALDTATERCSVALRIDGHVIVREVDTPRGHADLILPMVQAVTAEAGISLRQLDGLAYGRGPGGFTGVRIAIGVAQGLAFGAELLTIGVSNLAAVAQQVASHSGRVLVCMDARMQEVYWGVFARDAVSDRVVAVQPERVGPPDSVNASNDAPMASIGTGFSAYPSLAERFGDTAMHPHALPHAREIAFIAEWEFAQGRGVPASEAQPVYLRDNVAIAKK